MINCELCQTPFTPARPWQTFCSATCRNKAAGQRNTTTLKAFNLANADIYEEGFTAPPARVTIHPSVLGEHLHSPGCFGWMKDGRYLLIAMSPSFWQDLKSNKHIGRREPLWATDELHLWLGVDKDIREMHFHLIKGHKPIYNREYQLSARTDKISPALPDFKTTFQPRCFGCKAAFSPLGGRGSHHLRIQHFFCSIPCYIKNSTGITAHADSLSCARQIPPILPDSSP